MTAGSGLRPRDPPLLHLPAAKQSSRSARPRSQRSASYSSNWMPCRGAAERAWTKRKGPMARYRLDVATHVAALRRAIRWARVSGTASTSPRVHSDEQKPRSSRAAVRTPPSAAACGLRLAWGFRSTGARPYGATHNSSPLIAPNAQNSAGERNAVSSSRLAYGVGYAVWAFCLVFTREPRNPHNPSRNTPAPPLAA